MTEPALAYDLYDLLTEIQPPPQPLDLNQRTEALERALEERILVLDGATGTALQAVELTAKDFGGPELDGCNELLCVTRPDVVDLVHERYLQAGADIVETNSFGSTPLVLDEYDQGHRAFELSTESARLARVACARHTTEERPRFVCGSIGPTTKAISVTGGVSFDDLRLHYRIQTLGLMAGGADYLLLETCQDTRNIKAGLLGIDDAFEQCGWRLPVAVSVTIEPTGTMLAGQDAEALAISLLHKELLYVGLNCATGPELMTDHLRTLSELCRTRVACVPNAGLPDEEGEYNESPEDFRRVFTRFFDANLLNLVGGCCGTTDAHIELLAEIASQNTPRSVPEHDRALVSGLEAVELTPDNRPLLVGERTNVLGSRKFKRLISSGELEQAAEIGRAQVKAGAQIVDVCLQDPDRDETSDMEAFLDQFIRLIKAPLMIDSTDAAVMERALTYSQGKAILNSINLEDGLQRFNEVVPLARQFGAAVVVGLIDEQGMAVSVERKMEVARRSYRILTQDYGLDASDIWWDALVFPCGTGDENYIGSAGSTVEAVRQLKEEMPATRGVLGISNVSFGLPLAGREVLNSVFLYHATRAGLDAAIVNTQRLARYAEISDEERKLAEDLLFVKPGDVEGSTRAIEALTQHFRGRDLRAAAPPRESLPLPERIARSVVEGSKVGLTDDLAEALKEDRYSDPLDIINGPLMSGMKEVGRLFNDNQLIVAEVLQSAEVMKAAVAYLEPFMERAEGATRGKVMLATVKGDVHDIGKNLVDIILTNNGFEVINLGIKVPNEQLIQAAREHQPDVIGLSGLLVKSAQQMISTAADLDAAGISVPLIAGGAALTRRFVHGRIAPGYSGLCTYGKDAMSGLVMIERMVDPEQIDELTAEIEELAEKDRHALAGAASKPKSVKPVAPEVVDRSIEVPAPPDLERHAVDIDLDSAWNLINPQMLYGKHLGLKGPVEKLAAEGNEKWLKLEAIVDDLKELGRSGAMECRGVWQFFPATAKGDEIILTDPVSGDPAARWTFPRKGGTGICLADYVLENDHVALFVTTAGAGVRARAVEWKEAGEYLKSHAWSALALETAEGAAEWVHRQLRAAWGFPDSADLALRRVLSARYRGKRYSFGYPACPDLGGQQALFQALRPEDIGVQLTEGDMMDPEASVSALVFHHPEARYFGV